MFILNVIVHCQCNKLIMNLQQSTEQTHFRQLFCLWYVTLLIIKSQGLLRIRPFPMSFISFHVWRQSGQCLKFYKQHNEGRWSSCIPYEFLSLFLVLRTDIDLTGYCLNRWNMCWQPWLFKPLPMWVHHFNGNPTSSFDCAGLSVLNSTVKVLHEYL